MIVTLGFAISLFAVVSSQPPDEPIGRFNNQRIIVRRGTIEQLDAPQQIIRVRFETSNEKRYLYIHPYVRLRLDSKPGALTAFKERVVADVHWLEDDNIVISVEGYQHDPPPRMERVKPGPFEDTEKIVKYYPRPNLAMKFSEGENLRVAIPRMHLVPLARAESDLDRKSVV